MTSDLGVRWDVVDYAHARVLSLAGEMDVLMAGMQEVEFTATVAESPAPRVLVDMTAVDFCDSTGIGILVRAAKTQWSNDRSLELVGVQPYILRQLSLVGLDAHFPVHADLAGAGIDQTAS